MKLLKTEQILWEKTYSKSLLFEITLKPWPQKVTEVVPRVVALNYEWQDSSIVVAAHLYVDVYFSDKSAAINFIQHEKSVTDVFLPEKVAEGMEVYVSCHAHIHDMNLSGDILRANVKLDFKLEGVVGRQVTTQIPREAVVTKKITAFQSFGTKTWMGSSHGIFQKPDLSNILAIKPHVERLEAKLFHGLALVEGSICLDIFYVDANGLEKYDRMYIPIRESNECEIAAPQRHGKASLEFSGVKHSIKNKGECEIIVAYKLGVKVLERKERDVIVEINEPGYEYSKRELILNQNACQGTVTLMLEEDFCLSTSIKKVVDVYGRVENLTCDAMERGFVARGILGIELYFICDDQRERCKYLEVEFRKSKLFEEVTGAEEYELVGRVLHITAEPEGEDIKVKVLLEIDYTGVVRKQLQAITDVNPGEGVQKELFHIERCLAEKSINFTEKFEVITDKPIELVESIKGEIENVELTITGSKVLIQCNLSVNVFYAGPDGFLYSKKAIFPLGIFEDLEDGKPQMQVKVRPWINDVKIDLVTLQKLRVIFMLKFDILATVEEDIYLVTVVPTGQVKIRQVFCEDHEFNITCILPLTAPLLMVKDVEALPQRIWLQESSSGLWTVVELAVCCSYVSTKSLIHQDFERLDFRFRIPDKKEIDYNNILVSAKTRRIVCNPEEEMVEAELEIKVRTFHFANVQ